MQSPQATTNPIKNTISRLEWIALIIILMIAAVLRFGWLGVNSFAFDEAYLSLAALNMARGGHFATIGMPSSAGVPNLPVAVWIFSIPYLISSNPLVATCFVGLLSLLAVWGIWWLAHQQWGAAAGLAAALFLAVSPYSVLYARNIWAQNLLPPLAVLWLITGYQALRMRTDRWIAIHVFVGGIAFQVHYAGIALTLGTLWLIVVHSWWRKIHPVLIGGLLSVLAIVPTIWRILFSDPQIIDQFRRVAGNSASVDLTSLRQLLNISLGRAWSYLALGEKDTFSLQLAPTIIVAVLLVIGLLFITRALVQRKEASSVNLAELIILSAVFPVLWLLRHTTPPLPHYQLVVLPAAALLIGATVYGIRGYWRWIPIAGVVVLSLIWSAQLTQSFSLAAQTVTPKGLGTPLSINQAVATAVPPSTTPILFTHGDNPDLDGEAAIFSVLWWDRPHRIVDGENLLILPDNPTYIIATVHSFQAWEELDAAGLAQLVERFPRREGELTFIATVYDGKTEPSGFTPLTPVLFAHGVQLEGWKGRRVGDRLRISTLWRVMSLPASGTYQQFHHLRTATTLDGEPFKVSDVPLSAKQWRIGDRLIVIGDFFPEEPDQFWVDIGHYTLPDLQRILRTDGKDSVRIGPFDWK
jgi:4-amino-4-deoxy-L-arabinose transferase-like glycosyltransferase